MAEKTIYNLSEKIEMVMSHPEEVIMNKTDDFNLWILRSGKVGLTYSRPGSELSGQIMDSVAVKEGKEPMALSLNFITKKQLTYEVKSLSYSSFYYLDFKKLIETLKDSESDFQYYCFVRDKLKNIPDEFDVARCKVCKNRFHFKFDCPVLHYQPNRDKAIFS